MCNDDRLLNQRTDNKALTALRIYSNTCAMIATTSPIVFRTHRPGDIGHVTHRHGVVYARDYGWDERFEAMVARILADFIENYDAKRERSWIAERDGEFLGCIFLTQDRELDSAARIRALLVEPGARGTGLGSTLIKECINFAREAGYQRVVLRTQSLLAPARRLYKATGFRLVRDEGTDAFAPNSRGETWQLEL